MWQNLIYNVPKVSIMNYQHSVETYAVFIIYGPDINYLVNWRFPFPEVNLYVQSSHNVVNATFHVMKKTI